MIRRWLVNSVILFGVAVPATIVEAQTLTVDKDIVAPGTAVTVTVSGNPGLNYAIVGSPVGSGLVAFGVPLKLGTDYTILAQGVLNSGGQATASIIPPFLGSQLDRYYIQAALSPSVSFNPLVATNGVILRNQDLIGATSLAPLVFPLSGPVASNIPGDDVRRFAGPTVTITTTSGQRLVGSAAVPLGITSGQLRVEAGFCYQSTAAGAPVTNFVGEDYATFDLTARITAIPVAAAVTPGAGTWRVGACVRATDGPLNTNDYMNGWVMVVSQ